MKHRRFQADLLKKVADPNIDTVAFSCPRANGKTYLGGRILANALTPGHPLNRPGKEYILGAASLEQARLTYAVVRQILEPSGEFRWLDSATRLGATHIPTNTKLRAISSNAKSSFGLVGVPVVVLDEAGALENVGGQMLADSLMTAQGKPGSDLKLILLGTLAPQATQAGHWWHDLATGGSTNSTHVKLFQGNAETWDQWPTIRKANPLVNLPGEDGAKFRQASCLEERDEARNGLVGCKARFLLLSSQSFPPSDASEVLLTVDDFETGGGKGSTGKRGASPIVWDRSWSGGRAWSARR